jgi:hypothetical protein
MAIHNADAQPDTSTMDTMRTLLDTMPLLEPMRENGLRSNSGLARALAPSSSHRMMRRCSLSAT